MDYIELNLLEMLDTYGEDKLQSILSSCFMCPQNIDVGKFYTNKGDWLCQTAACNDLSCFF